jgi:hypothetical protein
MPGKKTQMKDLFTYLVDDVFPDGNEGWLR